MTKRERANGDRKRAPARLAGSSAKGGGTSTNAGPIAAGEDAPVALSAPNAVILPPESPAPVPLPELSHYKGTSLANIGRDSRGRTIPHKRSEVTARKVATWVLGGYNVNDIAIFLNIRPGLVKSCYGRELAHGEQIMGMGMTEHIVARAKKSDRMAIFVAKARMGWRDGEGQQLNTGLLNIIIHA